MPYEFQTNALLPYALFATTYLVILAFGGDRKDTWAFWLLVVFVVALGLRNPRQMSGWADPVWYAAALTKEVSADQILFLGGIDYLPLYLLHGVTSRFLDFGAAFFFLHMLYLPVLFLIYRLCAFLKGMFFLLAGWLLFVNSGVLLLANFFRQGQGALYLLVLIFAFSLPAGSRWLRVVGALALPTVHLSSVPFAGGLLISQRRRFYVLFGVSFVVFCLAAYILLRQYGAYSVYLNDPEQINFKRDLITKTLGTYVILALAFWIDRRSGSFLLETTKRIQQSMFGFLMPTVALLMFANAAPEIGTRFIYYFHAIAFAYLSMSVARSGRNWIFPTCALGFCLFGAITWTYPTVAVLLVW